MTSQIVLINQEGIAIASDTMTSLHIENVRKTRSSEGKIFELGGDHRVVVMHNGSVAIDSVLVKTLIREWSRQIEFPFPRLIDYVENFDQWLVRGIQGFRLSEHRMLKKAIEEELRRFLQRGLANLQKEGRARSLLNVPRDGFNSEKDDRELSERLAVALAAYQSKYISSESVPKYPDLTSRKAGKLIKGAGIDVTQVLSDAVSENCRTSIRIEPTATLQMTLLDFCSSLLARRMPMDEETSSAQLNFVGFGTEELMGGLVSIDVRSLYAGRLRGVIGERQPSDPDFLGASVFPLAQKRAMNFILDGLDKVTEVAVLEAVELVLNAQGKLGEGQSKKIGACVVEKLRETRRERIAIPVRSTLSGLNLNALIKHAEALVQTETLRAATREVSPTVGGPVEVVSISRWQKPGVQWH